MTVAIIDYGSGNLRSAAKALERALREDGQSRPVLVTAEAEQVARAEAIVLPGVGAFGDCRQGLAALDGMEAALEDAVIKRGRPFLGICVGMQLMAACGYEHGEHRGLGWIDGDVVALELADPGLKVPHMGWNELQKIDPGHPVLDGLGAGTHVYFVHGYHLRLRDPAQVLARCDYGGPLVAVVGRDNLVGTQFHPEKSQAAGLRLLGNFLRWRP
ncbi:MAG: imidazole glycerol phosphate synthase subunit HisH [Kiloniellales bacterium]